MARFDRQVAMALRLIKKNGQLVVWRQLVDAIPDPSAPWKTEPGTAVDNDVYIAFFTVDKDQREFIRYLTGTEVKIGDVLGYMGQVNFIPNPKDIVIRDGVEYRILNLDLLSPNGQKILYTVEFLK